MVSKPFSCSQHVAIQITSFLTLCHSLILLSRIISYTIDVRSIYMASSFGLTKLFKEQFIITNWDSYRAVNVCVNLNFHPQLP